jgi:hypothetical protein
MIRTTKAVRARNPPFEPGLPPRHGFGRQLASVIVPSTLLGRCYQLAGLLRCGTCGRLLESCWSNGKAAYRCRHGHTTATRRDPARPPNAYIREDQILPRLPALGILLGAPARKNRSKAQPTPRTR